MNIMIKENHKDEVLDELMKRKEAVLEALGTQAEGYAKVLCPVDTGNLRNSITHQTAAGEDAVYIGTNVEYAPYVEMGTRKFAAQPFLRPAVQDHADEYRSMVNGMLK